jgi:SPP1 gp7 family putative phage head morphogenesis protein|tara:strand:- start:21670 stop:22899 length:1230 start_codon:yes stop_codon:yes gene_type:complete
VLPQGVPFVEAIDYLRQKVPLPSGAWTDLWQGMHARAFVVAGANTAALVEDFHGAVQAAISEGRSLAQFREDFDRIVAAHGWSYNGKRGWRSAVIYNTNLRMAQSAGRWGQASRVAARKRAQGETLYIRYLAVLDSRTRPAHRAWHDIILPIDHAFWETHWPPNGWNCRCTIQVLTGRQMRRQGLEVTPEDDLPSFGDRPVRIRSADGDRMVTAPTGIDAGFAYNPGVAGFGRGPDLVAMEDHGPWTALASPFGDRPANPAPPDPKPTTARLGDRAEDEEGLRQALRAGIGGDEVVLVDPLGARTRIGQAIVDHILQDPDRRGGREPFFPLIPDLIQDPSEIWIGWAQNRVSGRVALRRRYYRAFEFGSSRAFSLVADQDGGTWSGFTVIPGTARRLQSVRSGLRIFAD